MAYTYRDFISGKIHKTSGKFEGWTNNTGILNVKYAVFHRPKSSLFIPEYCLTKETKDKLDRIDIQLSSDAKTVCNKLLT